MKIKASNEKKITVELQVGDLAGQTLTATAIGRYGRGSWTFSLPQISFTHDDRSAAEDVISALKAIATWGAKVQGREIKFGGYAQKAVEQDGIVIIPCFKNNIKKRFCRIVKNDEGFWVWGIDKYVFTNDTPSMAAYIATIQKLIGIAYGKR